MRLLVASHNPGKVAEVRLALASWQVETLSLADLQITLPEVEVHDTYLANAAAKAQAAAQLSGLWALADDSGLEVDALNGRPGVHAARWAGPHATDADRIALLLTKLTGLPLPQRTARFVCVLALAAPEKLLGWWRGVCQGVILDQPRGHQGFGYDPVFMYLPWRKTFAEVSAEQKSQVSHRGRALAQLKMAWPRLSSAAST